MSDHHDKHHDKHHHKEEKHRQKEEEKYEKHHHKDEYRQEPQYGGYPGSNPGYNQTPYPPPSAYGGGPPQPGYGAPPYAHSSSTHQPDGKLEAANHAYAQEHSQKRNEHIGEFGALAAGAYALYEAHQVKVDPTNAGRHRIEETVAGVAALGSGGFAVYEHQQVRAGHKIEKESNHEEKKHHHGR